MAGEDKYIRFHSTAREVVLSEKENADELFKAQLQSLINEAGSSEVVETRQESNNLDEKIIVSKVEKLFEQFRSVQGELAPRIAEIELKIYSKQLEKMEIYLYDQEDLKEIPDENIMNIKNDLKLIIQCLNFFSRRYPSADNGGVNEAREYTISAQTHFNNASDPESISQGMTPRSELRYFRDFITNAVEQIYRPNQKF